MLTLPFTSFDARIVDPVYTWFNLMNFAVTWMNTLVLNCNGLSDLTLNFEWPIWHGYLKTESHEDTIWLMYDMRNWHWPQKVKTNPILIYDFFHINYFKFKYKHFHNVNFKWPELLIEVISHESDVYIPR